MAGLVKTTLIVTAHNYGRFLRQCVESVLAQTADDWELIVVDDGSTDDTPAILAGYAREPRVSVHRLEGVGLAAAVNHGIRQARGSYIMRLDADDFLEPHAAALLSAYLDRHPDVGLVYPDHFTVDEEGAFLGYTRALDFGKGERGVGRLPLPGGSLCRKACYDTVGGYDETLRYQEDYEFWLRLTQRYAVAALHLPLLSYRQHAQSMSRNVASRAAARRHVRRAHAVGRTGVGGLRGLAVIPSHWPGEPARPQSRLQAPLGGMPLLDHTLRLLPSPEWAHRILVVGSGDELERTCRDKALRLVPWPQESPAPAGWSAPLALLRALLPAFDQRELPHWDFALLLSPDCPFRHRERIGEMRDVMALHACDLVVSIDGESAHVWKEGSSGLIPLDEPGAGAGGARLVREAGELCGARREWLQEGRPLESSRTGYVELLPGEAWTVRDELSAKICEGLAASGVSETLAPGAFLRAK